MCIQVCVYVYVCVCVEGKALGEGGRLRETLTYDD